MLNIEDDNMINTIEDLEYKLDELTPNSLIELNLTLEKASQDILYGEFLTSDEVFGNLEEKYNL